MTSKQYANQLYFCWNQSLRAKQKNNEETGIQISINVANASLWILIRKACVGRTLAKFLKNYLKGKNALRNQAGSEWLSRKNQYCVLLYYPLIINVKILWKICIIFHIDLQDTSNILVGCIIISRKVFAKSLHQASCRKWEMSTRQIMMSIYLLWRVKRWRALFEYWWLN